MSQTQAMTATAIAADLLQSLSVEITLFAITLAIAVALRGAPLVKAKMGSQKASHELKRHIVHEESGKATGTRARSQSPPGNKKLMQPPSAAPSVVEQKLEFMVICAKRGQSVEAIGAYEEMRASGQHTAIKDSLKASRASAAESVYALLVQCAGKAGRADLVELLMADMKVAGIERSLKFYESAMKMLASNKCYKEALSVCSHLEADGLEPSPVTLSCLINFAAEVGESERAIGFFNRLAANGEPSIRAYMTILRMYSKRPDWGKCLALIRYMQNRQAPIDSLALNVALASGVAAGELAATKGLLKEFSLLKLADVVSYNTVMKGLSHQREVDEALQLLDEMRDSSLKPNAITFNTAMDAAVRSSRVADAWGVLVRMLDAGLTPDKFTCTTLMKGLQMGSTSEQLSLILDFMRNVTKDCDLTLRCYLFRSVIEAAAKLKDPKLTAKAIAQLRDQSALLSATESAAMLKMLMDDA